MSSTRLPGKVLLPLGNRTVLEHVAFRASQFASQVVVCTSTEADDDPIERHCAQIGVVCVRGPLQDVFSRFRYALEDSRVERSDWFARVTADCPLLSSELAQLLVSQTAPDLDVVAVRNDDVIRGVTAELIRREPFEAIDPSTLDEPQREHVTLCLYERPETYRTRYVSVPPPINRPDLRLTVDYEEDYRLVRALLEADPDLTAESAAGRLVADPDLAAMNRSVQQKPPRPGDVR